MDEEKNEKCCFFSKIFKKIDAKLKEKSKKCSCKCEREKEKK